MNLKEWKKKIYQDLSSYVEEIEWPYDNYLSETETKRVHRAITEISDELDKKT